jgi:thiaminase (transcriptional activator TenA)
VRRACQRRHIWGARLRFGHFVGTVSAEENTYFLRAFEALGITESRRATDPDTQPTMGSKAIMRGIRTVMALRFRSSSSPNGVSRSGLARAAAAGWHFVHAEWMRLHDNQIFRGFVDFLHAELDRVGLTQVDLCRDFFCRAVALELSFFEAAYTR